MVAAVELGELIGVAAAAVTAMGTIGGIVAKTIARMQGDNSRLALKAIEESAQARREFTTALAHSEQAHATNHAATMETLRHMEAECARRAEEAQNTVMGLLGLKRTDTGTFRKDGG